MRFVSMIFGLTFLFITVMPVTQAYADKERHMQNPCGKMMNPCEKKEYMERHKQKQQMKARVRQLMEQGMDMWVETVQLLKESASDPGIKKKAAALEQRMRANIHEHKALHQKMHEGKGHGERYEHGGKMHGGGHNPCGKNPCSKNPCGKRGM